MTLELHVGERKMWLDSRIANDSQLPLMAVFGVITTGKYRKPGYRAKQKPLSSSAIGEGEDMMKDHSEEH